MNLSPRSTLRVVLAALLGATGVLGVAVPGALAATYVPAQTMVIDGGTGNAVIQPGGTAEITIGDGTFTAGETVTFILTGYNASGATLAALAVETATLGTKTANSNGGVTASITLPSNAQGSYTLNASADSASVSADFVVLAAGTDTQSTGGIATTGVDERALYISIWAGVGLIVIGASALAMARARRKTALLKSND